MSRIGIIGAGAFGGALAVTFARAGAEVVLWGREGMEAAARDRALPRLGGVALPEGVRPTSEAGALGGCDALLLAVPTQALAPALAALPGIEAPFAVACCKGVELASLRGPTAILAEALPGAIPAILSGPSFAADIARGLPTALSLGCADARAADLQHLLATPGLRLYRTDDVAGVELGGALKNVVAIACGAAVGASLGESARAALMTRGMAETMRLATALGARRETLMGLSGLGDLALTCASPQSRNFAHGAALGRGEAPAQATVEGVHTARAALDLARGHGVELPVAQATAALVAGRLTVAEAMEQLLSRDLTEE
jgi:glycerol-3-phosphate dehydrogenase (NAD(P)+)